MLEFKIEKIKTGFGEINYIVIFKTKCELVEKLGVVSSNDMIIIYLDDENLELAFFDCKEKTLYIEKQKKADKYAFYWSKLKRDIIIGKSNYIKDLHRLTFDKIVELSKKEYNDKRKKLKI